MQKRLENLVHVVFHHQVRNLRMKNVLQKKRFKNIRSAAKKIIEHNIQYPKFPSASSIIRSPLINIENDNPVLRKHDRNISVVQEANTSVKTYNITDTSIDTNHTFLTSSGKNDFLIDNAVLRKHDNNISVVQETNASVKTSNVTDIFTDINHTFFTTDEKMNYLIGPVEIKINDKKEDNIADLLPIKDLEQLENFEKELQNKEIYNQMMLFIIINLM